MAKAAGLHELLWIASVSTCIKLLMIPSYRSTDFEVHRHWLAVTHSLPVREWYSDETSEWTLDYPPFFAWFERFLALFASRVDPRMVDLVGGLNYAGDAVVLFQRGTVILADGVLLWGLWEFCKDFPLGKQRGIYASVVLSPGLFIVDHMHFQYNGFLLGILLLSLADLKEGRDLQAGVWFAVLVCFKHLFAVAGPIYFVYLLRHYCRGPSGVPNFLKLASAVLLVVGAAFGPFVYFGQMGQVLKRLFPFGRGLSHAYWAPNVWALYNATDKVLAVILRRMGVRVYAPKAHMTGGLVGDITENAVLPQVTPSATAVLVLLALMPCLIQIWKRPRQSAVVGWIAYAYMCGFMFGWHVHEKACLQFIIPMSLTSLENTEAAGDFIFLSTVSYYSLFPLLFEAREYPVKVLLLVLYTSGLIIYHSEYFQILMDPNAKKGGKSEALNAGTANVGDSKVASSSQQQDQRNIKEIRILEKQRSSYLWGVVVIEIYTLCLHTFVFKDSLPFLPLLITSVYCALGQIYIWSKQFMRCIFQLRGNEND